MTNSSNIIVVDGHTYTWEWQDKDLVLLSKEKIMSFMMAFYDFEFEALKEHNRQKKIAYRLGHVPPTFKDLDDMLFLEMHDPDLIEDYVNKHKETATVINNYED